ncbi:MAG: hypothetical protein AAB590_00085 [Patescibacteria group bacterium]
MRYLLIIPIIISVFVYFETEAQISLSGSETVEARAYIVYDIRNSKIILSKNLLAQLPLASLTKLMTAYVYAEDTGLEKVGNNILCRMLVTSDNRIAEELGVNLQSKLQITANNLGMKQSFFLSSTGLDISENLSGAYGSARDISIVMGRLYSDYRDLLDCTTKEEYTDEAGLVKNTNKYVGKTVGILGSKTGLTDLAGGNLAVIIDVEINRPVIIVVLGSSEEGRFSDISKLLGMAQAIKIHE